MPIPERITDHLTEAKALLTGSLKGKPGVSAFFSPVCVQQCLICIATGDAHYDLDAVVDSTSYDLANYYSSTTDTVVEIVEAMVNEINADAALPVVAMLSTENTGKFYVRCKDKTSTLVLSIEVY